MKKSDFCLYLSQEENEKAAKEISLKIKSDFRHNLNFLFILFTPHYNPEILLKTFTFTLKTSGLLGIKAPFLIYKDRLIKKGVVGCCINSKEAEFNNFFFSLKNLEKNNYIATPNLKKFITQDTKSIFFLSPEINPLFFLDKLRLSPNKTHNFSGMGFEPKSYSDRYFMLKEGVSNGLVDLKIKGIRSETICLHNFMPLGKPFNITKINFRQQIINEINNKPAIEIYKHYLEEKFTDFVKNRLFNYYPLGIPIRNSFHILRITDILEDGSLIFKGNLCYKTIANIMILKGECSKTDLANKLKEKNLNQEGLALIAASLSRKKNMEKKIEEELRNIKEAFWPQKEIFGFFPDYYLFSNPQTQDNTIESGGILINVWE